MYATWIVSGGRYPEGVLYPCPQMGKLKSTQQDTGSRKDPP